MHKNILAFGQRNAHLFSGSVLEVGSQNVNGTIREVLPITLGVDFMEGRGVDRVVDVCDLEATFGPESFDCVVSCDALEHMEHWNESLRNMWAVLKPRGIFLLTIAHPEKGVHGYPHDYHRIGMQPLLKMFKGNQFLDNFKKYPSMGVCLRKTGGIDYTIRPFKVGEKP